MMGKELMRIAPGSSSFYVGCPTSSVMNGGTISGMEYLVPQSFATRGNQTVSRFF
jgi:hypothetical protein